MRDKTAVFKCAFFFITQKGDTVDLTELFAEIDALPYESRVKDLPLQHWMRQENYRTSVGFHYVDILRAKTTDLPGMAQRDQPAKDLPIPEESGLEDSMAVMHCPSLGMAIIENRWPILSPRSFCEYYSFAAKQIFDKKVEFDIHPILRREGDSRLGAMSFLQSADISLVFPERDLFKVVAQQNPALAQLHEIAKQLGTNKVSVKFSWTLGRQPEESKKKSIKELLARWAGSEGTTRTKLQGRRERKAPTELINFIENELTFEQRTKLESRRTRPAFLHRCDLLYELYGKLDSEDKKHLSLSREALDGNSQ